MEDEASGAATFGAMLPEPEPPREPTPRASSPRAATPDLSLELSSTRIDWSYVERPLTIRTSRPPAEPGTPRLSRRQTRMSLSRQSSSFMSAPATPSSSRLSPFSFDHLGSSRDITPLSWYEPVTNSAAIPQHPVFSSKHCFKETSVSIAFHGDADDVLGDSSPMAWSPTGVLAFGRGNRVHVKNLNVQSENVSVLLKIKESAGILRLLEFGADASLNHVAAATSKGHIQIWDVVSKKKMLEWHTIPASALSWTGSVLTIGGEKGTIRHFDTRIKDPKKMKDGATKVTRHQARITSLAWNHNGTVLASGDASGVIYCWDNNRPTQLGPLDVGEQTQRHRRKMQHPGAVRALAWCPWLPKMLASGDAADDGSGTIRLWNINEKSPNPPQTDRVVLDAQVTSLLWSPECKELLSTHALARVPLDEHPYRPSTALKANAVAVHSFPSLSQVTAQYFSSNPVLGSAISANGCKVAFAVPGEKLIKIFDVWGKQKAPPRVRSMTSGPCGIR